MKKILLLTFAVITSMNLLAQTKEISRSWTGFAQSVDASFLKKKVKYKVIASARVVVQDTATSGASIWARVDNKKKDAGKTEYRSVASSNWQTYAVEGIMDESTQQITFGASCGGNGSFFFDNFEFYVENEKGELQKAPVGNASFEMPVEKNVVPLWTEGTNPAIPIRV